MIGGYLSFQGIEGRARYRDTPVESILPVSIAAFDDRVEVPQGAQPTVRLADHPIVTGMPGEWPSVLGYNRVVPKDAATVVAQVERDPLIVAWEFGRGRAVAFTSDCGPHWCPQRFTEWDGYVQMWQQLAKWAARLE